MQAPDEVPAAASAEVPNPAAGFSQKLREVRNLLAQLNDSIESLAQEHALEVRTPIRSGALDDSHNYENGFSIKTIDRGSMNTTPLITRSFIDTDNRGDERVSELLAFSILAPGGPEPPQDQPATPGFGVFPPIPGSGEPAPGRVAGQTRSAWKDDLQAFGSEPTFSEQPPRLPEEAVGPSLDTPVDEHHMDYTPSSNAGGRCRMMEARMRAMQAPPDICSELPGANTQSLDLNSEDVEDVEVGRQESLVVDKPWTTADTTYSQLTVASQMVLAAAPKLNDERNDGFGMRRKSSDSNSSKRQFMSPLPSPSRGYDMLSPATSARNTLQKRTVSIVGPKEEVAMRIIRQSARSARSSQAPDTQSRASQESKEKVALRVSTVNSRGSRTSISSNSSAIPVLTLATWKARNSGTHAYDQAAADRVHSSMNSHTKDLWRRAIMRSKFLAKMRLHVRASRTGMPESERPEDDEEPIYFWMSDIWKERKSVRRTVTSMSTANVGGLPGLPGMCSEDGGDEVGVMPTLRLRRWYDGLMINPNWPPRIMWDMIGCLLFIYDAIFIPLEFFNLTKTIFLIIMSWFIRLYWTFDIPLSFVTGKEISMGNVEMNHYRVAKMYLKTWFVVDLPLVFIEWLEIAGESRQEFGIARLGKMARNLRMLRMFRFLKLIKTVNLPEELKGLAYIRSEKLMIVFGIVKIMVAIVWVTHFIACFWYGIGNNCAENGTCWVQKHDYASAPIDFLYTTSFHWALTQFTGNMEILAWNTGERVFTIAVLLVAFVISAFAVSSITTSMTRLQIVTAAQSTQFSDLRKYLAGNNISKQLAMRIQKSANAAIAYQQKNMPEEKVELIFQISEPLRIELHYEVNATHMTCHPFFQCYDAKCRASMRQICHQSIERLALHRGDLVFSSGEMPEEPVMFFIVEGKLLYLHNDAVPTNVKEGQWAAEAVLWTLWVYHGTMRAKGDCNLLILDAQKFQKIACQFLAKDGANPIPYGREFVKCLNNTKRVDLTDLEDPKMELAEVVKQVFGNMARRPSFGMTLGNGWMETASEAEPR